MGVPTGSTDGDVPRTFNEKVHHRMAFDRRPLLTTLADKLAVRRWVAERVGSHRLTEVYASGHRVEDVDWHGLPDEFVCKATHACGGSVIAWDGAPLDARLPTDDREVGWRRFHVRPDHVDRRRLAAIANDWLSRRYGGPEWVYRDIRPGLLVEELLTDPAGDIPGDHRFLTFGGTVRAIIVESDVTRDHRRDVFDRNWRPVPVVIGGIPRSHEPPPRPDALDELLGVAERLGRGIDFVRVDLYALPDRIVVGELTTSPNAGAAHFDPPAFDAALGACWTLRTSEDGHAPHTASAIEDDTRQAAPPSSSMSHGHRPSRRESDGLTRHRSSP
jgi:hypothetical protein